MFTDYIFLMAADEKEVYAWFRADEANESERSLCSTRDQFQGRLDHFYRELLVSFILHNETALLTALVGEIGNNCFDHNLGQWKDVSGCRFQYGITKEAVWITLADRGVGVLSSLQRVKPDLKNDQDALEIAFHKRLSGRSPERRGNGLKFVRNVINGGEERGLYFESGAGTVAFGRLADACQSEFESLQYSKKGAGTFAYVLWRVS